MSADLGELQNWLAPLLHALAPAQRRQLAAQVARAVRQQTQRTMRAQTSPEGQPWEKRRAELLAASGPRAALRQRAARGPMMRRLALARNLKMQATPDEAVVAFVARVQRIAAVHQWGLSDRVSSRNRVMHTYAARPMLGISPEMTDIIRAAVLDHLQKALQKE